MRLLLMADKSVGANIAEWLLEHYRDDVAVVVVKAEGATSGAARRAGLPVIVYENDRQVLSELAQIDPLDLGVLAWWPSILGPELLEATRAGFINTHPSLLPHNRGRHYNFWAIVEEVPFGVSLHMVSSAIDAGDIVAQLEVPYGWEDTGKTLYEKAASAMVRLFQDTYPKLRRLDFPRIPQATSGFDPHRASELDVASRIDLDGTYTGRALLNLLRARTFPPHPAAWFTDEGATYEVRISITPRKP
jgi:methionyl-tRNA formyltransferase